MNWPIFIISTLAGLGALFVVLMAAGLYFNWRDQRRQDEIARKLAALRFDEISPIDQKWAREKWPVNFERAKKIAVRRRLN